MRAADVARPARGRLDPRVEAGAARIVEDVRARGEVALREHAERLGDVAPGAPLVLGPEACRSALDALDPRDRVTLVRVRDRIRAFAEAQRESLAPFTVPLPGGRGGQRLDPVERVGCYAPGGRFPLPSSVLMTAVPGRVAGCREVWLASPRPAPATLAAAALAEVDGVLAVGGAQAVAALAFGVGGVPAVDFVCGPGNAWVTAAKRAVFGEVGVDMLAGPSELLVIADAQADAGRVAADLLAQAEHDPLALPVLVTPDPGLAERVDAELEEQLSTLPEASAACARRALTGGFCALVADLDEAAAVSDRLAPEHLSVQTSDAPALARRLRHWGALFVGGLSAEVFGDYGAGPNHVLPTGGGGQFRGGLSVLDFLRARTWLELDGADAELVEDAARLGRLEGLEAHARSAERRRVADGAGRREGAC